MSEDEKVVMDFEDFSVTAFQTATGEPAATLRIPGLAVLTMSGRTAARLGASLAAAAFGGLHDYEGPIVASDDDGIALMGLLEQQAAILAAQHFLQKGGF